MEQEDEMLQIAQRVVRRAGGSDRRWAQLFERAMKACLESSDIAIEDPGKYCDLAEVVSITLGEVLSREGS